MATLAAATLEECNRVRDLIPSYERMGPAGHYVCGLLRVAIARGEAAIASGGAVECFVALKYLRECSE